MPRWPWIERKFNFEYPPTKFPDILERVRGTPARTEALIDGLPADVLTRSDGKGWTIQENVGHLADVHHLWMTRIDELLAGAAELTAADMTGRRTHDANHNARDIKGILSDLRRTRDRLVDRLEPLCEDDWGRASLHPRLNQPMRLVDLACFVAEHDDYHLARVRELIRQYE